MKLYEFLIIFALGMSFGAIPIAIFGTSWPVQMIFTGVVIMIAILGVIVIPDEDLEIIRGNR